MKIVKPEWINDSTPIITCDIHPDGSRFALGGNTKGRIFNPNKILIIIFKCAYF